MATKASSVVVVHSGEHMFKVVSHSQTKGIDIILTSDSFHVGGHDWAILYNPNGDRSVADEEFASVFVKLMDANVEEVMASFSFCLQDPAQPVTGEKHKFRSETFKFSSTRPALGTKRFVSKSDLATSGCIKDDCLVIKCVVGVSKLLTEDDSIVVPPSNLTNDLCNLLESGVKADMTIKISWFRRFKVHACVLAARSPVFRAQLCGFMRESRGSSIRIDDMDARVFEVMLHYMYKDCLPDFMEETTEEATNMAQHLLVAANRYAMERLKVICESKLSKTLDVDKVGFILDFAEQYDCELLKDCCLKYMGRDLARLRAIKRTDGFEQLKKNHPLVVSDILDEVVGKLNPHSTGCYYCIDSMILGKEVAQSSKRDTEKMISMHVIYHTCFVH